MKALIQSHPDWQKQWPQNWDRPLCDWFHGNHARGTWGAYSPLKDEPPILDVLIKLPNVDWVFPRITASGLEFCRVKNFSEATSWIQGRFSPEPGASCEVVPPGKISGLLIPALAYDPSGLRLGRGGGYYDRFLQGFQGLRVGVIHSAQVLKQLPADGWDQRVDWIATEKAVSKSLFTPPSSPR